MIIPDASSRTEKGPDANLSKQLVFSHVHISYKLISNPTIVYRDKQHLSERGFNKVCLGLSRKNGNWIAPDRISIKAGNFLKREKSTPPIFMYSVTASSLLSAKGVPTMRATSPISRLCETNLTKIKNKNSAL